MHQWPVATTAPPVLQKLLSEKEEVISKVLAIRILKFVWNLGFRI